MLNFKNKIKQFFSSSNNEIQDYFPITKRHLINYFIDKVTGKTYFQTSEMQVNFIITSKAEIRVFTPILNYIIDNEISIKANLFFSKNNLNFDGILKDKIKESNKVVIQNSPFILSSYPNCINVICLDHQHYKKAHKVGIDIVEFLNKKKGKTVCLQHGGNQDDYIQGHLTSIATYQIVYGKIIYNKFFESGFKKNKVYLTGNPLHDKLIHSKQNLDFDSSRRIISLITCMHTEYDNKTNPEACYIEYLKNIYQSINFKKCLLVIKMHPYDSLKNNLYQKVRLELNLSVDDIKIIRSDNLEYSVYDLISASNLIISRASTVIEEALMLKKNVIAYDLFEEGSSVYYDFLNKYSSYTKVIEDPSRLKLAISNYVKKEVYKPGDIDELIENTTYKLDGKSSQRVIDVLVKISKNK